MSAKRGYLERILKNEDRSQWLIENKGKKSAPNEFMKTKKLSCFGDELMKGKEIGTKSAGGPWSVVRCGCAESDSHKPLMTDNEPRTGFQ